MNRFWKSVFAEEETALVKNEALPPQVYNEEDFLLSTKSGDWLPRLQLMTSNSDICKEGKFPVNHYSLIQSQNNRDMGTDVDVLVIAWRPKAIEMGDEVITVFDTKHPEFIRIQEKSTEQNSGCMFGPEFLVYIPTIKEFATFFMGSKSTRREAPGVKARMLKGGTLKSHLVKTAKFTWQVPICVPCTTPFEIPEENEIKEQATKFLNPPATTIEKVSEAEKAQSERAR